MAVTSRSKTPVTPGEAQTIIGATEGLALSVSGTEATIDLATYAGKYVKLYCLQDDVYFAFSLPSVTGAVLVTTTAATKTDYVADCVGAGATGAFMVVPEGKTLLHAKTVNSLAGTLRALRA